MSSVCLKIYMTEKQRHNDQLLHEWLLDEARKIGIEGGSVFRSIAGYGRHGRLHDDSFFELAGELPIQVEFVLEDMKANELMMNLQVHQLNLFYMQYPVVIGHL
mgnify:FL=1